MFTRKYAYLCVYVYMREHTQSVLRYDVYLIVCMHVHVCMRANVNVNLCMYPCARV